eukprot:765487-Hanusia_phi.AAC.3
MELEVAEREESELDRSFALMPPSPPLQRVLHVGVLQDKDIKVVSFKLHPPNHNHRSLMLQPGTRDGGKIWMDPEEDWSQRMVVYIRRELLLLFPRLMRRMRAGFLPIPLDSYGRYHWDGADGVALIHRAVGDDGDPMRVATGDVAFEPGVMLLVPSIPIWRAGAEGGVDELLPRVAHHQFFLWFDDDEGVDEELTGKLLKMFTPQRRAIAGVAPKKRSRPSAEAIEGPRACGGTRIGREGRGCCHAHVQLPAEPGGHDAEGGERAGLHGDPLPQRAARGPVETGHGDLPERGGGHPRLQPAGGGRRSAARAQRPADPGLPRRPLQEALHPGGHPGHHPVRPAGGPAGGDPLPADPMLRRLPLHPGADHGAAGVVPQLGKRRAVHAAGPLHVHEQHAVRGREGQLRLDPALPEHGRLRVALPAVRRGGQEGWRAGRLQPGADALPHQHDDPGQLDHHGQLHGQVRPAGSAGQSPGRLRRALQPLPRVPRNAGLRRLAGGGAALRPHRGPRPGPGGHGPPLRLRRPPLAGGQVAAAREQRRDGALRPPPRQHRPRHGQGDGRRPPRQRHGLHRHHVLPSGVSPVAEGRPVGMNIPESWVGAKRSSCGQGQEAAGSGKKSKKRVAGSEERPCDATEAVVEVVGAMVEVVGATVAAGGDPQQVAIDMDCEPLARESSAATERNESMFNELRCSIHMAGPPESGQRLAALREDDAEPLRGLRRELLCPGAPREGGDQGLGGEVHAGAAGARAALLHGDQLRVHVPGPLHALHLRGVPAPQRGAGHGAAALHPLPEEADAEHVLRGDLPRQPLQRCDPEPRQHLRPAGGVRQGGDADLPGRRPGALHAAPRRGPPAESLHGVPEPDGGQVPPAEPRGLGGFSMSPSWLDTPYPGGREAGGGCAGEAAERGPGECVVVMRPGTAPLDIHPIMQLSPGDMPADPEGGAAPGGAETPGGDPTALLFCSEDPELDRELSGLHQELRKGRHAAQLQIDARLMACWIARTNPALYASVPREALVLHPSAAYHHKTLPDIGRFIVQSLVQREWKADLIVNVICNSMPCLKRNRVNFMDRARFAHPHATVLLNLLHGLLMGLYPNTAKRPSFGCRVRVAGELRRLMTSALQEQGDFLFGHLHLLKLAVMEYVWHMASTHMVTEHDAILKVHGMPTFLEVCPNICDAFRQEQLQAGGWGWAGLNEAAAAAVDRCVRTCKFRVGRLPASRDERAKWRRVGQDQLHLFAVAREMHACVNPGVLWSLYHPSHPGLSVNDFSLIEHIHARCRVYPLPCNLVARQAEMLLDRFGDDHAQFTNVMKVHICLRCCNKIAEGSVNAKLRLCMDTGSLVCTGCGVPDTVVAVNMLGKVLVIQSAAYYLCPACGLCRRWAFDGTEFTCVSCRHTSKPAPRRSRSRRCLRCSKANNLERATLLLPSLSVRVQVSLCSKHTLPAHIMKYVVDVGDYCRAAREHQRAQLEAKAGARRRR